jgi:hypothetical protein
MSTKMQVEWRRAKVLELLSKGDSQSEIAKLLQVDLSIISRDVYFLRQQAKVNIKKYIDERLPEEYEKCLVGLTAILRSLAKECYSMKLELLTNATVVDDAIRFVLASNNTTAEKTITAIGEDEADATAITNKVF